MDGFPLNSSGRRRRPAVVLCAAAFAVCGLRPRASAETFSITAASGESVRFESSLAGARFFILEQSDKESILRRLDALASGVRSLQDGLGDTANAAATLRRRSDDARAAGVRDGYFPFDLSSLHDAVWSRRAEAILFLDEVQRLQELAGEDRDISSHALNVARTAADASAKAAQLNTAARALDASVGASGDDLLGQNAGAVADLCAQDSEQIALLTRQLEAALEDLAERTHP